MTAVFACRFISPAGLVIALTACSGIGHDQPPEIVDVDALNLPSGAAQVAGDRIALVRQAPDDPWANGDLAALLHAYGRLGEAAVFYERAERLSDGDFRWRYLLGVTQQNRGLCGDASASFRRALAMRRYAPATIRLGESLAACGLLEESLSTLRDAAGRDGGGAAAAFALGRVLLEMGRDQEAVAQLEKAVRLAPESGAARYALSMALRAEGNDTAADRHLAAIGGRTEEKPPLDDPLLASVRSLTADEHHFLNRGRSLEARGRLAEAIRSYEKALDLDPAMASAHANLVGAYGRLGNLDKAEEHYRTAIAIDPNIEELHNSWGVVLAARDDPNAAAEAFRRALRVNPNSATASANLGVALAAMGDPDGAARHFGDAIANDPTNRPARMNLGVIALEKGRHAEAIKHLQLALEGSGSEGEAFTRFVLGRAYEQADRWVEARDAMSHALRLAEEQGLAELAEQVRASLGAVTEN